MLLAKVQKESGMVLIKCPLCGGCFTIHPGEKTVHTEPSPMCSHVRITGDDRYIELKIDKNISIKEII